MTRRSDRWITPAVVIWLLVLGTVLLLAIIASITFLTYRGLDPDPMIRLTANVAAAVGTLGTFVLQLNTRRTTTNVERKVGLLEAGVVDTLDELDARGRHAAATFPPATSTTAGLPPVPGATRPHPLYGRSAAPTLEGS